MHFVLNNHWLKCISKNPRLSNFQDSRDFPGYKLYSPSSPIDLSLLVDQWEGCSSSTLVVSDVFWDIEDGAGVEWGLQPRSFMSCLIAVMTRLLWGELWAYCMLKSKLVSATEMSPHSDSKSQEDVSFLINRIKITGQRHLWHKGVFRHPIFIVS